MLVGLLLTSGFVVRANAATDTDEDDNNFRDDVFECEEAVAHASACCGFKVQGDACRFYYYYASDDCGCSGGTDGSDRRDVRPVISGSSARYVANASCEELEKRPDEASISQCERLYAVMQRENESSSRVTKKCN